jgi:protoheme IX farnesyltransferase
MDEDYQRAGIKLLPSKGGRNMNSALQIMLGTLILIPVSCLPMWIGITGFISCGVAVICGLFFLVPTLRLIQEKSQKVALKIMFSSFLYLPIVQIAYLLDKI